MWKYMNVFFIYSCLFVLNFNIDAVNILIFFWSMEFIFIIEFIPNFLNTNIIFENIFGVLFQVQIIWYKVFWKVKWMLESTMKKN